MHSAFKKNGYPKVADEVMRTLDRTMAFDRVKDRQLATIDFRRLLTKVKRPAKNAMEIFFQDLTP